MEKEIFNNHSPSDDDGEFVDLNAHMFDPIEQWEPLTIFGHDMASTERDTGSGFKELREETNTGHGRVVTPIISHFNVQAEDTDRGTISKSITNHESHVEKVEKFSCSICKKTYKKKNNLISHMRKHVLPFN